MNTMVSVGPGLSLPILRSWWWSLLLGLGLVLVQWVFLVVLLGFDPLWGDPKAYWEDSFHWQEFLFDPFHMPGYPFTIAVVRGLVGGLLPPAGILWASVLIAFVLATLVVRQLATLGVQSGFGEARGLLAVAVFVLWPFVGTLYVALPYADMLGMGLFLLGLWLLLKGRSTVGGVVLGLALVSHKALWPVVGLVLLAHLLQNRSRWALLAVGLAALPLAALWLAGASYHGSAVWLLTSNLQKEIGAPSGFPIFSGLVESLRLEGLPDMVKGATILGVLGMALVVAWLAWRLPRDHPLREYSLAIAGGVFLLVLILNEHEIWASVRFGRLLVVPATWLLGDWLLQAIRRSQVLRYGVAGVVLGLVGTQFAFAVYVVKVFSVSCPSC